MCYTILYCVMLCYAILYYTMLYYTILYYTLLFYTKQHYNILYYSTILYYTTHIIYADMKSQYIVFSFSFRLLIFFFFSTLPKSFQTSGGTVLSTNWGEVSESENIYLYVLNRMKCILVSYSELQIFCFFFTLWETILLCFCFTFIGHDDMEWYLYVLICSDGIVTDLLIMI